MARGGRLGALGIALWIPFWVACVSPAPQPPALDFFRPVPAEDLWLAKIRLWQATNRSESLSPEPAVADLTPLAEEYTRFSREFRLEIAQRVLRWVQLYSGLYFRSDDGGDYWPTLGEVIAAGGDDCDGMELLTFTLLRRLGFGEGELYRAILFDRLSEGYHMVSLWFQEEERNDPYVIDPSGEVSRQLLRLSRIKGWEPVAIFDERSQFRVEPRMALRLLGAHASR